MGNCGNCGSCSGCAKSLELTQAELEMLDKLSQFAFLPVCRKVDDMTPVYFEDADYSTGEYSIILQLLEQKRLISIDYSSAIGPVQPGYPVGGSIGLTERGQLVVEQLQLQGLQ